MAGIESRVYANPTFPPTKKIRGVFQNLTCNAVDNVEASLSTNVAWIRAIGTQSAGRYIKISKRLRQPEKLQVNVKAVGIFKTTDEL